MLVLLVAGMFMTILPGGVLAQNVVPEILDENPGDAIDPEEDLEGILQRIAGILAVIAVGVLVIALIIGAIMYMTAGGDPEKAKSARTIIINGVIGAVVLFAIAFIIGLAFGFSNILNP